MAQVCIYTLEPLDHGGVMAKVRVAAELQKQFGHSVNLLFTATEQVPTGSRWEIIRYFVRRVWPYWAKHGEYSGLAVPHWPLPIWMTYLLPWAIGRSAFADRDIHLVVSGANQCGIPAALARKRYVVWIGTLYADELRGKALTGDRWSLRMLAGLNGFMLRWQERIVFERASMILTNGEHTASRIREVYPQVAQKVRVVTYPVDTDLFHPDPTVRDGVSSPYLLFTARINDLRKNVAMLFRAYARVRRQHPEIRLVLTGDAADSNVQEQLALTGMTGKVDIVGRQSLSDLVRLYQGAELFVLSSNQEGLGISILEATACGLPVVTTRCGGPESVVVDDETGYLVPLDDDAAMAERILALLADPELMERMRVASAALAQRLFSRASTGKFLLQAFRDVYPEHFSH